MNNKCFLYKGCPNRTAACRASQPTDEGCPIYRWFRDTIFVRCKDCRFYDDRMQRCSYYYIDAVDENFGCLGGQRIVDNRSDK